MSLHVIAPGLSSLIVDFGRPRCRSLGVPVGGAADRTSLSIGNALVGNPPDTPALEISLAGPSLLSSCSLACVVFGAPFDLASTRQSLEVGTTFTLRAGERLDIGGTPSEMRAYLCVGGGFSVPRVLGSGSALQPVRAGAELACTPSTISRRTVQPSFDWNSEPQVLHALDGPQADWFVPTEFFGQHFTVTPASDRMGLRLQGAPFSLPARELASEPVCPGSVQVTREGQPIVLGVDGQTIGGYPRVAQVITADLDKLGQLRPGDVVQFRRVTLAEAEQIYRRKQTELHEWLIRLRTAEVFP